MPRVYQRLALAPPLLSAALLLACGCAAPDPDGRDEAAPLLRTASRALATESLLDARSYELVAAGGDPMGIVANELSADGSRAVIVPVPGGDPVALAAGDAGESRALAALPGGQILLEEVAAGATRLVLHGPEQRRVILAPLAGGPERLLAVASDCRRFWSAARSPEDGTERLIETQLPSGSRRALESTGAPFTIGTLSPDGNLVALRRTIHDESDEIVLSDRRTGEMRLLLPDRDEGRFRPLEFLGTDRFLLLLADDGGDRARLETIDLSSGRRRRIVDPGPDCSVIEARRTKSAELRVDFLCSGRRESRRLELSGRPHALPELPAPMRTVSFLPLPDRDALALAVVTVPATDLWSWSAAGGLRPLTYGAAPALDPAHLGAPETTAVGPHRLPAELWIGATPARAGLLWLEEGATEPRWGELEPALTALVHRGFALLRVRARGASGFGRQLRRAADGDPAAAILTDLDDAAAVLAARLPARTPLLVVAQGDWEAAALLAALGGPSADRFVAGVALFPDPDPLALLDRIASTPEPARGWLVARWGEPAAPKITARRTAWRFPIAAVRRPALLVLDRPDAASGALQASVDAARTAGRPVEAVVEHRPPPHSPMPRGAALLLIEFFERHLAATSTTEAGQP